jgi:KUP system potassium uptake protein
VSEDPTSSDSNAAQPAEPLVPSAPVPPGQSTGGDRPSTAPSHDHAPGHVHGSLIGLAIGAVGVVFGDIGTSPLYAIQEMVVKHGSSDRQFVLGILSIVFWALFLIVVLKYQLLIMRATNRGEGGLFALLSLLPR